MKKEYAKERTLFYAGQFNTVSHLATELLRNC